MDDEENKNLDYLIELSRNQLKQTMLSYDETKKSSSIHLGISTFLFTIIVGIVQDIGIDDRFNYYFLIPLIFVIISFGFVLLNFDAKILPNGYTEESYLRKLKVNLMVNKQAEIMDNLGDEKVIKDKTKKNNIRIFKSLVINVSSIITTAILIAMKINQ